MRNASIAASLLAAVVLIASPAAAAEKQAATVVRGLMRIDGAPLPGAEVMLTCHGEKVRSITNVAGEYVFALSVTGRCAIDAKLDGLEPAHRDVEILPGPNDAGVLAMKVTPIVDAVTIVTDLPCASAPAIEPTDAPSCAEYDFNSVLIEARTQRDDGSAIGMLERRLMETASLIERHRIAGALLGTRADAVAWKALMADAEIAVRFPQPDAAALTPEFSAWCNDHGLIAWEYRWCALDALRIAGADKRSQALLERAMATDDVYLLSTAIDRLGRQHDASWLPKIEAVLLRFTEGRSRSWLAFALQAYESEAAEALSRRYLDRGTHGTFEEKPR